MAQPATKARDLLERHLDWFADVSRSVDELAARRVISAAEDLLPVALPEERAAVYTLIGLGQYRAGRLDRALDAFRNALRVDRARSSHHHNVAAVLIELGRSQEALRHLDDAQRLPTRSKHDELIGAVNAAEASHRLGNRAAVVAAWRRAQTIATDGDPYDQFLLAHAAAQIGFDDDAVEHLARHVAASRGGALGDLAAVEYLRSVPQERLARVNEIPALRDALVRVSERFDEDGAEGAALKARWTLDDAAWDRFEGLVDDPPPPTEALRRLMGERGA